MLGGFSFSPYHMQDSGAKLVARSAEAAAGDARAQVDLLKCETERLLMICEALWTILKEQHGYDDEELAERIRTIDMKDGKLDGRVAKAEPTSCPNCGRTLSRQRPVCMYCGGHAGLDPFRR